MKNIFQMLSFLFVSLLAEGNVHHHAASSTACSLGGILDSLSELTNLAKERTATLESSICSKDKAYDIETYTNVTQNKAEKNDLPINCASVYQQGNRTSGIYKIWPLFLNHPISVFCDMETAGGGWTLIQRRGDFGQPTQNFYQTWESYKNGFGNLTREFWLGNDIIFVLTNQDNVVLRVDLEDFEGGRRYAEADEFLVRSERELYKMSFKTYKGDAGDSLSQHNNMPFTTKDRDNDKWEKNCAEAYKGGWWYNACHHSNLNGMYLKGPHEEGGVGVNWYQWRGHKYSLKISEMKIRPIVFLHGEGLPK
ncbi:techylectin-5B [Limulus polyphemus]|uniref:Techylectin-5B n=1 Tax=Limulus polyphemus TaxID=6850 RepID=A0ABM1C335_LIMPO|nr:techylectin-5B [Limulus polyphemus]